MDKLNLINFEKYTITEDGKIFSNSFNKKIFLKGCKVKNGYLSVYLRCKDGKSKSFLFHRVIWFYFKGEIPKNLEINHKDENKANNSLDNLELLSRAENINYGTRNERVASKNKISQKGKTLSESHIKNLSISHSKPILQYNIETNEPIKEWSSIMNAAKSLGYSNSTIGKVCSGMYTQAYGFGWKYL